MALNDLLKETGAEGAGEVVAPSVVAQPVAVEARARGPREVESLEVESLEGEVVVERIEVSAILGGCLQLVRLTASGGRSLNPAHTLAMLRVFDPGAQVLTEFPTRKSFNRETKPARAVGIMVEGGNFLKIKLICEAKDKDGKAVQMTVIVSKRNIDTFAAKLHGLGRLPAELVEQVGAAITDKGSFVQMLAADVQFGLTYSEADDKTCYLEEMTPEPPVAAVSTKQEQGQ